MKTTAWLRCIAHPAFAAHILCVEDHEPIDILLCIVTASKFSRVRGEERRGVK
jgi:hypothetical protein